MNATAEQKKEIGAMIDFIKILADTIRDAGPQGIPSGHLYAAMMGKVTIDVYNYAIGILKKTGLVSETHYLLTWIGPKQ